MCQSSSSRSKRHSKPCSRCKPRECTSSYSSERCCRFEVNPAPSYSSPTYTQLFLPRNNNKAHLPLSIFSTILISCLWAASRASLSARSRSSIRGIACRRCSQLRCHQPAWQIGSARWGGVDTSVGQNNTQKSNTESAQLLRSLERLAQEAAKKNIGRARVDGKWLALQYIGLRVFSVWLMKGLRCCRGDVSGWNERMGACCSSVMLRAIARCT